MRFGAPRIPGIRGLIRPSKSALGEDQYICFLALMEGSFLNQLRELDYRRLNNYSGHFCGMAEMLTPVKQASILEIDYY
jgi:hypothetical protein